MGYLRHRRARADPSEYRGALCYNHYFCPGAAPGAGRGSEVRYGGSTVTFPDRRNGKYNQKSIPSRCQSFGIPLFRMIASDFDSGIKEK